MVAIGAGRPVQAVAVGHEQRAVAARLGAALRPVAVPAGARTVQPQRARRERVAVVQNGGFPLAAVPPRRPLNPAEKAL